MDPSVSGSQGQRPSSTRVLLTLLAFRAEVCGCRLLDENPGALWLTGIFHRSHTLESVLHLLCASPSCNRLAFMPYGHCGSSGNLNFKFFSASPSATLSHCLCPMLWWRPPGSCSWPRIPHRHQERADVQLLLSSSLT